MIITYACVKCGSENISRDATAVWCKEDQLWDLGGIMCQAYCDDCGGETSIEEVLVLDRSLIVQNETA